MSVEEGEEGRKTEWGERINQWEIKDKKLMLGLSDEPSHSESKLSPEEREKAIVERKFGSCFEVLNLTRNWREIGVDEFYPGPKVIMRTAELMAEGDTRDMFLKRLGREREISEERREKAIDSVVEVLRNGIAWESWYRRVNARASQIEEEAGKKTTTSIFLGLSAALIRHGKGEEIARELLKGE
jgi:hypothetical protein